MKKAIRVVIVFVCLAVIVGAGLNGAAWADKLKAAQQAPVESVADQSLQASSRPRGTVITTPTCIQTFVPGKFTIGSVAEWVLEDVAAGKQYEACVLKTSDLPAPLPGTPLASPIGVIVHTATTLTVPQRLCFPVPPGKDGYAYYWDDQTRAWIKTEDASDGQACVTVPAEVQAPTYVELYEAR